MIGEESVQTTIGGALAINILKKYLTLLKVVSCAVIFYHKFCFKISGVC